MLFGFWAVVAASLGGLFLVRWALPHKVVKPHHDVTAAISGGSVGAQLQFRDQTLAQTTGKLDQPTWTKLTAGSGDPILVEYQIAGADVKGPFAKRIPAKDSTRRCD